MTFAAHLEPATECISAALATWQEREGTEVRRWNSAAGGRMVSRAQCRPAQVGRLVLELGSESCRPYGPSRASSTSAPVLGA